MTTIKYMRHIEKTRKIADINLTTTIIILSMNALKTSIKKHKSSV